MAVTYRLRAKDGDDMHLKVALLELADEFEQEALISTLGGRHAPSTSHPLGAILLPD